MSESAMNIEMAVVIKASGSVMDNEIETNDLSTSTEELWQGATLEEFTFFLKLPLEIQRMIWKLAARSSRVLVLSDFGLAKLSEDDLHARHTVQTIKNAPPGVLQACIESRNECLKFYKPILGGLIDPTVFGLPAGPTKLMNVSASYLNPDCDILYVSNRYCKQFLLQGIDYPSQLKLVKSIAFNIADILAPRTYDDEPLDDVREILVHRQVQEIILVLPCQEEDLNLNGLELVPASSGFDQKSIEEALLHIKIAFIEFEAELREIAEGGYLLKPHPEAVYGQPYPLSSYTADSRTWAHHMSFMEDLGVLLIRPEREENPSEDALRKYAEAVKYPRPEVKIMELARGGVRIGR